MRYAYVLLCIVFILNDNRNCKNYVATEFIVNLLFIIATNYYSFHCFFY